MRQFQKLALKIYQISIDIELFIDKKSVKHL